MTSRLLNAGESVLLVVDLQERLLSAMDQAERLVRNASILVKACSRLGVPVVVSEQYPQGLGPTASEIKAVLPEGATVLEKTAFGCLGDCGIRDHLDKLGRRQVILCGIEAHVCVNQTAHQLLEAGYQVHLAQDTTGSRSKKDYKTALLKMAQGGVIPSNVEMILFELLADARHEAFKEIQAFVK